MVRKEQAKVRTKLGGNGVGEAYSYEIVSAEELGKAGRMFAKIVLPPGTTISRHQHVGETEPYYILSGEGDFIDNDGVKTRVSAGDICTIEDGDYHELLNTGNEDLVIIALIYYL